MSLFAPVAVAVEIREELGARARREDLQNARRFFRLSNSVSESGLLLERPAPFELGQPVTAAFVLPDVQTFVPLTLRAVVGLADSDGDGEAGGAYLEFVDPPRESRLTIVRYVAGRLGLAGTESRP